MRIIFDIGAIFRPDFIAENRCFVLDCLDLLTKERQGLELFLLGVPPAESLDPGQVPIPAARLELSRPPALGGRLTQAVWQRFGLQKALRKAGADLLLTVQPTGRPRVLMPWCGWLFGSARPGDSIRTLFPALRSGGRGQGNASGLLLTDFPPADDPGRSFGLPLNASISTVGLAGSGQYQSLSWPQKENIKVTYSGGREYFLVPANCGELDQLTVLRAFSIFKKRLQSNMQLLIAGVKGEQHPVPFLKLETYKHRSEVHIHSALPQASIAGLTASAYSLVQPGGGRLGLGTLNAFSCSVPVISCAFEQVHDLAGDAALYAGRGDPESIASRMIELFNEERKREDLIKRGQVIAAEYRLWQSVSDLWNGMMQVLEQGVGEAGA